ncbi:hypothetical protein RLIN73S_03752 [Rhodanobacter lindaniclasticus]
MVALSSLLSRNRKAEVRPITFKPPKRDNASIRFSDRPSEKYSCCASLPALARGSTAMLRSVAFAGGGTGGVRGHHCQPAMASSASSGSNHSMRRGCPADRWRVGHRRAAA